MCQVEKDRIGIPDPKSEPDRASVASYSKRFADLIAHV